MKKKILFIRANSTSPRVIKEATSLVRQNYDVHLFLWNRLGSLTITHVVNNIAITEYGFRAPFGNKVVFYWIFWWFGILKFLLRNKFDIVHVCGLDSYCPVIILKSIKNFKIVYDIFDFLGDSLPVGTPNILRKLIGGLERILSKFADAVIIVDDSRRAQIYNIDGSKIEIIMNCVDDRYSKTIEKYPNELFTIFYGGMLSKNRGLLKLLDVIRNDRNVSLIVAGSGEGEMQLVDSFKQEKNITFLGQISHVEALEYTFKCDVIFAFYNPEIPINQLASPNKLFEAMMCRTPIIVNLETTMAKLVQEIDCGFAVPYEDENQLKESIIKLRSDRSIGKHMGDNGRMAFESQYNWQIMESRLLTLYANLCKP